jgi:hypothetical protein
MGKGISERIVDPDQVHFDLITVADAADHVGFTGEVGCIQYRSIPYVL